MDTQVMAGHFISSHHRGLMWNWPSTGSLFPRCASDVVKQDNILNETTPDRSNLPLWLLYFYDEQSHLYFTVQIFTNHPPVQLIDCRATVKLCSLVTITTCEQIKKVMPWQLIHQPLLAKVVMKLPHMKWKACRCCNLAKQGCCRRRQ